MTWQTVATSNLGRAMQDIGAFLLHWLKLLQGVVSVALGVAVAFGGGYALLEPDHGLPHLVRAFVMEWSGNYGAVLSAIIPSDTGTIRSLALALLLAGLVLAGRGTLVLCNWFLDQRE
jgi:hypothetical protein